MDETSFQVGKRDSCSYWGARAGGLQGGEGPAHPLRPHPEPRGHPAGAGEEVLGPLHHYPQFAQGGLVQGPPSPGRQDPPGGDHPDPRHPGRGGSRRCLPPPGTGPGGPGPRRTWGPAGGSRVGRSGERAPPPGSGRTAAASPIGTTGAPGAGEAGRSGGREQRVCPHRDVGGEEHPLKAVLPVHPLGEF